MRIPGGKKEQEKWSNLVIVNHSGSTIQRRIKGTSQKQRGQLNKGTAARKQPGPHEDLDEGRGSKGGERKTPQCYFPPGQRDIIPRQAEQLQTDT